jgi:hypothetical protein
VPGTTVLPCASTSVYTAILLRFGVSPGVQRKPNRKTGSLADHDRFASSLGCRRGRTGLPAPVHAHRIGRRSLRDHPASAAVLPACSVQVGLSTMTTLGVVRPAVARPPKHHDQPNRQHRNDSDNNQHDGSIGTPAASIPQSTPIRECEVQDSKPTELTNVHSQPHRISIKDLFASRSHTPAPTRSSTIPNRSHTFGQPLAFPVRTLIRWLDLADDGPNNGLFGGRSGSSLAGTSGRSFSDPVDGSICSGPGRVPTRLVAASRDRCTLLPTLSTDP